MEIRYRDGTRISATITEIEALAKHGFCLPAPNTPATWYTPEQVAALLQVDVSTIRGWIASGRLAATIISPKIMRVSAITIIRFMRSYCPLSVSEEGEPCVLLTPDEVKVAAQEQTGGK